MNQILSVCLATYAEGKNGSGRRHDRHPEAFRMGWPPNPKDSSRVVPLGESPSVDADYLVDVEHPWRVIGSNDDVVRRDRR